jgi:hypothetical protein
MLLDGGAGSASGLALTAEVADVPWHVRMHERSVMQYSSHLVVARRKPRA